ncbi:MAG: RNA polymerase sigma factor [Gemmatimonadota bacterium]
MRREERPDPSLSRRLLAARDGDPAALTYLYEEYGPELYRIALGLTGSLADAEDVVQDVFVGLPEALRGFKGSGHFPTWIKKVGARTSLMRLRQHRRQGEAFLPGLRTLFPGSIQTMDSLDRIELEQAVAALPESGRIVFLLKVVEGLTHQEIGDLLGITPNASGQRLFRAIRQLRALLSEDE